MSEPTPAAQAMDRLLDLMARLRAPDGCVWDREQTPATLKPQMLEECYEVIEAIDAGSPGDLTEELGDLLLHIVFQAQIARETGQFAFADVANGIADKLVRRHPHVFGDQKVADAAGVVVGARVPIILTSRADSLLTRLASCAVASLVAAARRERMTNSAALSKR